MSYTLNIQDDVLDGKRVGTASVLLIALAAVVSMAGTPILAQAYSLEAFKKVAPAIADRAGEEYGSFIDIAALLHDYDEKMILAVMVVESEGKPTAVSHRGAVGLMQLMPQTAKAMGVKDPKEPFQNILAGTKYLKELERVYKFNREESLVAYNMGPARARRWLTQYEPKDSLYVQKVLHVYNLLVEEEKQEKIASANAPATQIAATQMLTKPKTIPMYESQIPLQNLRRAEVVERD
jgi:soluble lytic murein transglycosylase-like protein